jgi:hypothetical protein
MQNAVKSAFSKIFFKFTQIFEIFDHSPFSPKARSMAERCHRKRGVKFSAAFVTVRFWILLSVFSEKQSQTSCFRQKRGVKLIVVGENVE